ncbi:MAG: quaternary amine ABC transporter ATP-binding protein [Mangrovicoccus sp.]
MANPVEQPKVRIQNLYKVFGDNPKSAMKHVHAGLTKTELLDQHGHVLGLRDINLDIPGSKIQVIMGLSGSGKSTLIRHLNRLIEPTEGVIEVDGSDVVKMSDKELRDLRRFKMSMVFQKFGLLPHRTVQQNVEYGLGIQGVSDSDAEGRAKKWIDRVGLSGFEGHYPGQLSGGMQQRVGLARALATDAEILLMDEAFSALDPLIRTDMQTILLELQEELHKSIIFITHDLDEALRIGDKIAILRDGEIIQAGDPREIIMTPGDDYITDFIKDVNRAKVVRVNWIMGDAGLAASGQPLAALDTIEEALPRLHAAADGVCPVMNSSGTQIGTVSIDAAINALKAPETGSQMVYS